MTDIAEKPQTLPARIRAETPLIVGVGTTALFAVLGEVLLSDTLPVMVQICILVGLFSAIMMCAFGVIRHADHLAELLGEPLGTLILTLAVISIEVALISAMMVTGKADPALARDTMFAVLMIVLNGMVGLALLAGGLRHGQQDFNLEGARAFLAVVLPLAVITLVLPNYTVTTPDPTLSPLQAVFFGGLTVLLYGVFLAIQTVQHRGFFVQPGAQSGTSEEEDPAEAAQASNRRRAILYHGLLLFLTMLPIVILSKPLAHFVDHGIQATGMPRTLGGILIAVLVLTPEGITAFQAAMANRLQRAVNICLGSSLSTISLTVPAVLLIGMVTDQKVTLGLNSADTVLLVLTLVVSMLTFGSARTNMLQGAVHLVLFLVYLVLVFRP